MNAKLMKRLNRTAEEYCMALLKENLSDEEGAKVTKNSISKQSMPTIILTIMLSLCLVKE